MLTSSVPDSAAPPEEASARFRMRPAAADFLCHGSVRYGYVFVETPYVASRGLKHLLQRCELRGTCLPAPRNPHDRNASPLARISEDPAKFGARLADEAVVKFCFVRNPFTRVWACYHDKFLRNSWERARLAQRLGLENTTAPAFGEFLRAIALQPDHARDLHWASQSYVLSPENIAYDFIGRHEYLLADLAKLRTRLHLPALPADFTESPLPPLQLDAEEAGLVYEIYREDFERFGYGASPP